MNTESKYFAIGTSIISLLLGLLLIAYAPDKMDNEVLNTIMTMSGSFLTISVFVSLLYSTFIKPSDDVARIKELQGLLDDKIAKIMTISQAFDFDGIEEQMDLSKIFDRLKKGDTLWWLMTYDPHHGNWLDSLNKAIQRGAKVKILVMNPNSDLAKLRAVELLEPVLSETDFKQGINLFINSIKNIQEKNSNDPKSIEVVKYNDLPCAPIYVIENGQNKPTYGWSSYYLTGATGMKYPHIKWRNAQENGFLEKMHKYLVEKWKRHNIDNHF